MRKKVRVSIHTLIAIFVTAFYGLLYTGAAILPGHGINLYLVSLLGTALLLYIWVSWKRTYYRIFSPYIVVVTTLFMTLCGQVLPWSFGLTAGYRDLRYAAYRTTNLNIIRFSDEEISLALLFSYFCICIMHVVVINSVNSKTRKTKTKKEGELKNSSQTLQHVGKMDDNLFQILVSFGLVLILATMPFYIISSISQYTSIIMGGYGAQYENVSYGLSSIATKIGEFFPVGVITLLFAWGGRNSFNKKNYRIKASFSYFLTGVYLFTELRLSQRTSVILFAIAILFIFYSNRKFSKKLIVLGVIAGIICMAAMRMIDLLRSGKVSTIAEFISYTSSGQNSPVLDFLGDIGWNLMTTIKFQEAIPVVRDYGMGSSYLISLTSIIPNLNFWDVHPAYRYGNISNWLQGYLGFTFGIGCTPVAEAYYNFGSLGVLMFTIWGKFVISLNRRYDKSSSILDQYQIVLFMGLLLKSFVRSSFFAVFRPYIFYIWLPTVTIKIAYQKLSKRRNR